MTRAMHTKGWGKPGSSATIRSSALTGAGFSEWMNSPFSLI